MTSQRIFHERCLATHWARLGFRSRLVRIEGGIATGASSHVNLVIPMTAASVEAAWKQVGAPHGWRWPGLMDVWLDEGLMVELVPGNPVDHTDA